MLAHVHTLSRHLANPSERQPPTKSCQIECPLSSHSGHLPHGQTRPVDGAAAVAVLPRRGWDKSGRGGRIRHPPEPRAEVRNVYVAGRHDHRNARRADDMGRVEEEASGSSPVSAHQGQEIAGEGEALHFGQIKAAQRPAWPVRSIKFRATSHRTRSQSRKPDACACRASPNCLGSAHLPPAGQNHAPKPPRLRSLHRRCGPCQ